MQSPQKTTASPRKNPGSPRKGMGSPRKSASSPLKSESSPPKKMKTNCGAAVSRVQQPLVIIFEDVESFPTNILHDLILICRYVRYFTIYLFLCIICIYIMYVYIYIYRKIFFFSSFFFLSISLFTHMNSIYIWHNGRVLLFFKEYYVFLLIWGQV